MEVSVDSTPTISMVIKELLCTFIIYCEHYKYEGTGSCSGKFNYNYNNKVCSMCQTSPTYPPLSHWRLVPSEAHFHVFSSEEIASLLGNFRMSNTDLVLKESFQYPSPDNPYIWFNSLLCPLNYQTIEWVIRRWFPFTSNLHSVNCHINKFSFIHHKPPWCITSWGAFAYEKALFFNCT